MNQVSRIEDEILRIEEALSEITDPEIPVVTIREMGMLRDVHKEGDTWIIEITPTYSGCPATDMIRSLVHWKMVELGIERFDIRQQLDPAWTTDWMTDEARKKLEAYGIAPPNPNRRENTPVRCPHCGSHDVIEVSRFGSTACKSLWKCQSCLEPFDYFKCH